MAENETTSEQGEKFPLEYVISVDTSGLDEAMAKLERFNELLVSISGNAEALKKVQDNLAEV